MPWMLLLLLGGGAYFVWKKRQDQSLPMGGPVAPPSQLPPSLPPNMGTRMDVPSEPPPMAEADPDLVVVYDGMVFDQPDITSDALGPVKAGDVLYLSHVAPNAVAGWYPVAFPNPFNLGWIQAQYVRSFHSVTARATASSMFSPF